MMVDRLLFLAVTAICLALFVDGLVILLVEDKPIPHVVLPVKEHYQQVVRVIPPFPQLQVERPEEPDASVPDSGQPFERLEANLSGVVWSSNKWQSTISLGFYRDPDAAAEVFSLCDCVDNRPCNIVHKNYKLITIDVRHAVVLHRPSGVTQEFWVDGNEPPDAGVPYGKSFLIYHVWTKPYSWDGLY